MEYGKYLSMGVIRLMPHVVIELEKLETNLKNIKNTDI